MLRTPAPFILGYMDGHFHHDVIEVAWITAAAVVGINVLRILAAWLLQRGGALATGGHAIASLTTFSGA